jgi:hypothetical protein
VSEREKVDAFEWWSQQVSLASDTESRYELIRIVCPGVTLVKQARLDLNGGKSSRAGGLMKCRGWLGRTALLDLSFFFLFLLIYPFSFPRYDE